jgi:DNA-binding IclR family transcriptional regulator
VLTRDVRALINRLVGTVAHVDALLALRRAAPRPCGLAEIAEAARVPAGPVARRCVDELVAAELAVALADTSAYRYAPATSELRASVDALAAVYHLRPRLVLLALYGHPSATLYATDGSAASSASDAARHAASLRRRKPGPMA